MRDFAANRDLRRCNSTNSGSYAPASLAAQDLHPPGHCTDLYDARRLLPAWVAAVDGG
jgi:hypothetical protein